MAPARDYTVAAVCPLGLGYIEENICAVNHPYPIDHTGRDQGHKVGLRAVISSEGKENNSTKESPRRLDKNV